MEGPLEKTTSPRGPPDFKTSLEERKNQNLSSLRFPLPSSSGYTTNNNNLCKREEANNNTTLLLLFFVRPGSSNTVTKVLSFSSSSSSSSQRGLLEFLSRVNIISLSFSPRTPLRVRLCTALPHLTV